MMNPSLLAVLSGSTVPLTAALFAACRRARKAVERRRELEAMFRTTIETMQEGLVVRDANGGLVTVNTHGMEIMGLNEDQLAGRAPMPEGWQAFHEDGTPWPREEWPGHLALREGKPQKDRVMGIRMPWGETTWLSVSAVPLFREGEEKPYRVVTPFSDITVRKRREDRTRRLIQQAENANAELAQANARLADMALTDGLTGLRNHRAFQEGLAAEIARSRRNSQPLALIMVDVDEFKAYNDAFGHPEGDEALKQVAKVLASTARSSDLVARYGGEEFGIVVPETDLAGALVFAERLRAAIEAASWSKRAITASLGVATLQLDDDAERLIAEADAALYRSKREGRNRVSHATGDERGTFLLA